MKFSIFSYIFTLLLPITIANKYFPNEITSPTCKRKLDLMYEWKDLEYYFPTKNDREIALKEGFLVPGVGTPIDVAVDYQPNGRRRVFTTIPRFATGIPFSLAVVSDTMKGPKGPLLMPYPNYSWHSTTHNGKNCDGITSVFRVAIDPCNRLWVVDTGRIDEKQYCPPQIIVFDLQNDKIFHRYRFPKNQYKSGESLFITPIVDVRDPPPVGRCFNVKVYIADVTTYGLVVYDTTKDKSWRIEHETMKPVKEYEHFTIAGESFDLPDGIFGMSVTPLHILPKRRLLFYHGLASNTEVMVPLSVLDNEKIWKNNVKGNSKSFQIVGRRNTQSAAEAIDSRGNLYFGLMNPIAIGRWNIHAPWNGNSSARIIDEETLQFASGMKVVWNPFRREELWVSTCRFQKIMTGTKNPNEVNFRIQTILVESIC